MLIAKCFTRLSLAALVGALALVAPAEAQTKAQAKKKPTFPVLVEFFDSTTPAAQKLVPQILAEVNKNAQVVFLDYRLGLISDPKAETTFTQRRAGYACLFGMDFVKEPGLVVDGEKRASASTLAADIASASGSDKVPVTLSAQSTFNKLDIKATFFDSQHRTFRSRVSFVIVEDDPSGKTAGGASGERRLGVVREILERGFVLSDQPAKIDASCQLAPGWKKKDLRVVMFVQNPLNRKVSLCASCPVKVQE